MILHQIPLLMVLAFLGLTLVVGLYVSQGVTTFREYAVGNKRFHANTLVVTALATLFSIIIVGCTISMGLLIFVWDLTLPVTAIWSYILVQTSPIYKGCVVIDLLGHHYVYS